MESSTPEERGRLRIDTVSRAKKSGGERGTRATKNRRVDREKWLFPTLVA